MIMRPVAFKSSNFLQNGALLSAKLISLTFILMFLFSSCQKNLVQTDAPSLKTPTVPTESEIVLVTPEQIQAKANSGEALNVEILNFYKTTSYRTKWLSNKTTTPLYQEFIFHVKNADKYGLNPSDYNVNALEQRVNLSSGSSADIAILDIDLTKTFLIFCDHLEHGRDFKPSNGKNIWIKQEKNTVHNYATFLAEITDANGLKRVLESIQPKHDQYKKLLSALQYYRSLETISDKFIWSASIKPGETNRVIPVIRRKVALTNNEDVSTTDSLVYDNELVKQIKKFQMRHGLPTDGVIGDKTAYFLNQSFKEKADQILVNIERIRWTTADYGDAYISVNIPEFKLRIFEEDQKTLEMNVVVGALQNPTPIFQDTLEYLVFSPTWTVPPGIMKSEVLPKLLKNPNHYSNRDYVFYKGGKEIDPALESWENANVSQYRVVQKAGPNNALGLVKFMMPNRFNVYLHDTPDHSHFQKSFRALSHGCVRLDDPTKLAAYFLNDRNEWTSSNIRAAMQTGTPTTVKLTKNYPVYLEYFTVWVDANGSVQFREDIYGHDHVQLRALRTMTDSTERALASL
jgi:L,D-transpeptidase YcbB